MTYQDILFVIGMIALCAVWVAELSPLVWWLRIALKRHKFKRFKPFDCPKCLAFWGGMIVFGIAGAGPLALVYAIAASTLAVWISKQTAP